MDNKDIKSSLQDALEEEIPSSQVNLLPAVKASLVAGQSFQQGEKMSNITSRRIQRLTLIALMIAAFMTVALITPQGRAFAQTVLQFFTRAESTSFPVPVQDTIPDDAAALPPTPSLMSIDEAEAQARFDLAELPYVPKGFRYLGAGWHDWSSIAIQYEAVNGGGALTLTQSKVGYPRSEWAKVPAEAIVPVKIDDLDGEFVQGTFIVRAGESTATWNPSVPMLRLRWVKDGIFFQLTKFGDVESIEYLDQAGLIALAESLVSTP